MQPTDIIYSREDIVKNYNLFLDQRRCKNEDIIIQVSGGTTSLPLRIPRTQTDINDVIKRIIEPYITRYGQLPKRAAMLGGISHMEATSKLKADKIQIKSFSLNELNAIDAFDPEIISCYPSIIREILVNSELKLKNLKAIKLGGEPIFSSDIKKIFSIFENVLIIEQYGSTEMPAIAVRVFDKTMQNPDYILQTSRYDCLLPDIDGWHSIIVKDNCVDLIFNLNNFYDTGDEGYFGKGILKAIRRGNDKHDDYKDSINKLFELGCCNVQLLLRTKILKYTGDLVLPAVIRINDVDYTTKKQAPERLVNSNKLPLYLDK